MEVSFINMIVHYLSNLIVVNLVIIEFHLLLKLNHKVIFCYCSHLFIVALKMNDHLTQNIVYYLTYYMKYPILQD